MTLPSFLTTHIHSFLVTFAGNHSPVSFSSRQGPSSPAGRLGSTVEALLEFEKGINSWPSEEELKTGQLKSRRARGREIENVWKWGWLKGGTTNPLSTVRQVAKTMRAWLKTIQSKLICYVRFAARIILSREHCPVSWPTWGLIGCMMYCTLSRGATLCRTMLGRIPW